MKSLPHLELRGILTGTPDVPLKPHGKYVYQKTRAGHGNIPGDKTKRQQVRRWVRGTLVNTPAQQPHRARFALGVAAWHTLIEPEKEAWRAPAAALHLNRFQGFMRNWCRTQPLPEAYRMEIELDMTGNGGAGSATRSKRFIVADVNINPSNLITMQQSAKAATGRSEDENQLDAFVCRCVAGDGNFTAYIDSVTGAVSGLYRFIYHK